MRTAAGSQHLRCAPPGDIKPFRLAIDGRTAVVRNRNDMAFHRDIHDHTLNGT